MTEVIFLQKLHHILNYLRPRDPNLPLEEREKTYNLNIFILLGVHVITFGDLMFYLLSSKYPAQNLLFSLIVYILGVLSLFHDPLNRRLFIIVIMTYLTCYGPFFAIKSNCMIIFSMLVTQSIPLFALFAFRSGKLTLVITIIEIIKLYAVYLRQLGIIIESIPSKEELIEFIKEEVIIACVGLPTAVLLLYLLYVGYNHNMDAIRKITTELESSKKNLAQKDLLTLSLSHEARNPLNSIIGNLELVQEEGISPSAKSRLRKARTSADILLNLINNFIDAGKIDTNTLEICYTECALPNFIQSIWFTFEELIKNKGLHPKLEVNPNLPQFVLMDQNRVAQVLYNLISNAIKFTERGSVTLKVSYERDVNDSSLNNSIEEHERLNQVAGAVPNGNPGNSSRNFLKFEVIDTGTGISYDEQKSLFEKWNLPSNSFHKAKLGSGLGLWIIKEICDRLKADIKVQSHPGVGSSFNLLVDAKQVQIEHDSLTSIDVVMKNLGIMIVDDVSFNSEVVASYFKGFGIDVSKTATNGMEAVKIYENSLKNGEQLKIITMDLEMPLMGGKQACKEIRALEAKYDVKDPAKIIIISGNSVETEVMECLDPNKDIKADYFLRKPVKKEELKTILKVISSKYTGRSKNQTGFILFVECENQNPRQKENILGKIGFGCIYAESSQKAGGMYEWYGDEIKAVIINCEKNTDRIEVARLLNEKSRRRSVKLPVLVGLVEQEAPSLSEAAKALQMKIENKEGFMEKIAVFVKSL